MHVLCIVNNRHANMMIGLFNILSMINILSMVNKQVSPDGLGYKCNDQRGIFKSNFQHLSNSLGALSRENSINLADRTTHCRAVDKIFVLGVLIWLPKAALLGVQCLA